MNQKDNLNSSEPLHLAEGVQYSGGSLVSKTLVDQKTGTMTLFAFDADQGLSEQTYYRWRKEYGGLTVDQAKQLKNDINQSIGLF